MNTAVVNEATSSTETASSTTSSSVPITVQGMATSTPSSTVADIVIGKTVDHRTPSVGDTIHYMVNVAAIGPATSTGVTVNDLLPSGLSFVNATSSVGSYATSTGVWTIGTMSASSTALLQIAATVNSGTAGDTITNTATVNEATSTTQTASSTPSSSVTITVQGGGGGCRQDV